MSTTYDPGKKFRVLKPGCRLTGWCPIRGGHQGWGRPLAVGEIIECDGARNGFGSDPIREVHWKDPAAVAAGARSVTLHPSDWGVPPEGCLEEVQ